MKRVVVVLLLVGLVQWWTRDPTITAISSDVRYGYVVKYTGDTGRRDKLPMLIALHGDGDNASHFYKTALDELKVPARVVLLKGPTSYGSGRSWPWKPEDLRMHADALDRKSVG